MKLMKNKLRAALATRPSYGRVNLAALGSILAQSDEDAGVRFLTLGPISILIEGVEVQGRREVDIQDLLPAGK